MGVEIGEDAEEAADNMAEPSAAVSSSSHPQLPHGWEAAPSPEGHVYYYSHVTKQSQWELPGQDAAVAAGWRLFQAENGHWFYHNPYDGAGVWWPEIPTYTAAPESLDTLRQDLTSS